MLIKTFYVNKIDKIIFSYGQWKNFKLCLMAYSKELNLFQNFLINCFPFFSVSEKVV